MNEQEFEHYLDRFGAELSQWPENLRPAAQQLIESSVAAREHWLQAKRLAALFAAAQPHQAPADLAQHILRQIEPTPVPAKRSPSIRWFEWLVGSPWRGALTALIPLVVGFSAGWRAETSEQAEFWATQTDDAVYGLTLNDSMQEYYREDS